jgi:hypothetical protein
MRFVFKKMTEDTNTNSGSNIPGKNTQESITQAANSSMAMIDKLNNERFQRMNQIVVTFQWTTFYHTGGDPANSCTPCTAMGKAIDPRFVCESKQSDDDPGYLEWLRFAIDYKIWQRFPVYDANSKDTITGEKCEWYPESFNSALEWLTADLSFADSKIEFRGDTGIEKWSSIMASLYFLDKLSAFKKYAVDVWEFSKERIDIICGLSSDASYIIDRQYFDTAMDKLARLFGLSREDAIKANIGVFVPVASFCNSSLKNEYKSIKKEYDDAVEDIKQILATSAALTLCWNNATVGSNYLSQIGSNTDSIVNAGHDINQVLNCAGEQLKTEIDGMSDTELMSFMKQNRTIANNNAATIAKIQQELEKDVKKKINITVVCLSVIAICVFILFLLIYKLSSNRNNFNQSYPQQYNYQTIGGNYDF